MKPDTLDRPVIVTTFLRRLNLEHDGMGIALWEALLVDDATPASLINDLYAVRMQRIVLMNMQVSLTPVEYRSDCGFSNRMALCVSSNEVCLQESMSDQGYGQYQSE